MAKPPVSSDPNVWLKRALNNLILATKVDRGILLEDNCFDCQQAAEKAIKAVCVAKQIVFPFTHDLSQLFAILQQHHVVVPVFIQRAVVLNSFAVHARYSDLSQPVTKKEYRQSLAHAKRVVSWAERKVMAMQKSMKSKTR
jgi:HEPN domain-containing protein